MSFIFDISERHYASVAASSSESFDYIPANGEKVFIVNAGISSSSAPSTVGHICWDADGTPEVIISSYGEANHQGINKTVVGDGAKIMRISLVNDMTEPSFLGAFWEGEILK